MNAPIIVSTCLAHNLFVLYKNASYHNGVIQSEFHILPQIIINPKLTGKNSRNTVQSGFPLNWLNSSIKLLRVQSQKILSVKSRRSKAKLSEFQKSKWQIEGKYLYIDGLNQQMVFKTE